MCKAILTISLDCSNVELNRDSLFYVMTNAFSDCTKLRIITFPDSGIRISDSAFKGCTSLEMIKSYGHDKFLQFSDIQTLQKVLCGTVGIIHM